MMNVAATTRTFCRDGALNRHPIQKTLRALRGAGFSIIDWYAPECDLLDDAHAAALPENWERWADDVREMGEKIGVCFHQMHALDQDFSRGASYAEHISRMTEMTFRAARILGVRDVAIHPIISPPDRRNFDRCIWDNALYFKRLADLAGAYGLRLAIENMLSKRHFDGAEEWRFCTSWHDHRALVEAVDCENVGYCFDVGHAHYTGTDPYATPVAMGDRLFAIHVHDNDTFSDQHLLPWQGTLDFDRFARGLADGGYAGDMTMEVVNAANRMPERMAGCTLRAVYESAAQLARMVDHYKEEKEGIDYGLEIRRKI